MQSFSCNTCSRDSIFNHLLRIIASFFLVLSTAAAKNRYEIIDAAKNKVVEISDSDGKFMGSGFFIDSLGHVLTACHVVYDKEAKTLRDTSFTLNWYTAVKGSDRKWNISSPAVINTYSVDYDAAILRIKLSEASIPIVKTAFFALADSLNSKMGDDILCIGFIPQKYTLPIPFALRGMISTIRPRVTVPTEKGTDSVNISILQLDMTAAAGISGSPIIDVKRNEVIGYMVEVELPGKFKQSGFATAYSITNIKNLIRHFRR